MDGKGRWVENVMVERLWRSVKYEEVYLRAYDSVSGTLQTGGLFSILQRGTQTSEPGKNPRSGILR